MIIAKTAPQNITSFYTPHQINPKKMRPGESTGGQIDRAA